MDLNLHSYCVYAGIEGIDEATHSHNVLSTFLIVVMIFDGQLSMNYSTRLLPSVRSWLYGVHFKQLSLNDVGYHNILD